MIGDLLKNGVQPHEIAYVSFTRKAADEAANRAALRFGLDRQDLPYFRTIHSLAFRETGTRQADIMQRSDYRHIANLLGVTFTGYVDPADGPALPSREGDLALQWLDYSRARKIPLRQVWQQSGEAVEWPLVQLFADTVAMYKQDMGKKDFADLLDEFTGSGWRAPVKVAIIDEAQDLSTAQWAAVRAAFGKVPTVYLAGDDDQCQPAGTMVMTTNGPRNIATIDPATDRLLSFAREDGYVYGKRNGGYAFEKSWRMYTGDMYTVTTGGNATQCTADHHHLVRWAPHMKDAKWNAVYLMRRGKHYRIGWCQLFNGGAFHVAQRANKEDADAVWLLRVVDSKAEASKWESIYAAKFGIPTIPFMPVHGAKYFTREWIDEVFANVVPEVGVACLQALGLHPQQPFIDRRKQNYSRYGAVIMQHHVRNMQHGAFLTAVYTGAKKPVWVPMELSKEFVRDVPVYSLNVDKYHTYIADGIITHNCIHAWAGADVEHLLRIRAARLVLPVSHRLPREVFRLATSIAGRIRHRFEKEWQAADHSGSVKHLASPDSLDLTGAGSWMLLARNSCYLADYERMCREQGVPYTTAKGPSIPPEHVRAIVTWERMQRVEHVPPEDVAHALSFARGQRLITAPWHVGLTRLKDTEAEYYRHCLRNGYRLQDPPPVHVGTIHSVKGGEAENVVLRTDMTYRTRQGMEQDPDNENRVFYVGASRAKRNLFIIDPQEGEGFTV